MERADKSDTRRKAYLGDIMMFKRVPKRFSWKELLYMVFMALPLIVTASFAAFAVEAPHTGVRALVNGHVMLLVLYVFLTLLFSFFCCRSSAG